MTPSIVVADANVLFSRTLRDYFLYAADEGAIEIHWSQQILDEMSRNLREKLGFGEVDTARLERLMNDYIEGALVEIAPRDAATVQDIEMDAEDRHVLAAALSARADILLTDNTRHFPIAWMAAHHIELLSSARLLARLVGDFPDEMRAAHAQAVRLSLRSEAQILDALEASAGISAANAVRALIHQTREASPVVEGQRHRRRREHTGVDRQPPHRGL